MHLGVALFVSDLSSDVRDVARACEDLGFESFWVPEHTHIPVSRATPYPAGGDLPPEYARIFDPFLTLTAAAVVTERLRLGTGVCLVVERDPIHLAKETATLDVLSGGRLILGVGGGWNVEEMTSHGADPAKRWSIVRDRLDLVRKLWTQEVAEHDGPYAKLEPSWQWPKPVQRPHIPIHVGGDGPIAMKHAAAYGDGWMPIPDKRRGSMTDRIAQLATFAAEAGRPMPEVTAYACTPKREVVEHYASIGVARCVFNLPPTGDAVAALKQIAGVVM